MIVWIAAIAIVGVLWWHRRVCMLQFMECCLYTWVMRRIVPYVRFGTYYTSMCGWKYRRGYELLKAGDIILTRDNRKLTTFCIPGDLPHAALCVGKATEYEVAEMVCTGYTESDFFDICHESDRVVILRCVDWDPEYIQLVIQTCKSFKHKTYDILFKMSIRALSCAEMIYHADIDRRLVVDISDVIGLGTEYIIPQDLYEASNVEVVWDSDKEKR